MDTKAFDTIFDLQALDLEIDSASSRIENNKLKVEIAEAKSILESAMSERDLVAATQSEVNSEISRTTPKLVDLRLKREQLEAKVYDGSVTSQKELDSINSSIEFVNSELDELETKQLEEMERLDALEPELAKAEATCAELQRSVEQLESKLVADIAAAKESLVELNVKRAETAQISEESLLAAYQGLRDNAIQKPFARLVNQTCDGCNMAVAAVNVDRIKNAKNSSLENCDECGRVLVLHK